MWNEAVMVDGLKIMECWKLQTKSINRRFKTGEEIYPNQFAPCTKLKALWIIDRCDFISYLKTWIIVPFVTDSYTQFWYTVTKSTRIGLASKTRHLYHWWMIYLLPDMILMIQNKRAFIQNSQLSLLNFKISFPLQEPPLFIFSLNKILIKHHSNQHQFSVLRATR